LGETLDSIAHKVRRLGLKEGGTEKLAPSSSFTPPFEIALPMELPTAEDALRILAWSEVWPVRRVLRGLGLNG